MDATAKKILKQIAGLWRKAEKLQKQWASLPQKKAPKRKAKPKAKRRRAAK